MKARETYTRLEVEVRDTEKKTQLLAWALERGALKEVEAAPGSWEDTVDSSGNQPTAGQL